MLFLYLGIHVIRGDSAKKFNIFIRMKLRHFAFGGGFGTLTLKSAMGIQEKISVIRRFPFSYRDHNS